MAQPQSETWKKLEEEARWSTAKEVTRAFAHELNQPLFAIANYTQRCADLVENGMIDSQELAAELTRITNLALQAGEKTRQFSRFLSRHRPQSVPIDINQLIQDIVDLIDTELQGRAIRLTLVLFESLPMVLGDPPQIQHAVFNIVRNAIEAMGRSGVIQPVLKIQSLLETELGRVEIIVSNDGDGLKPGTEDQIFTPFFSTSSDQLGIGLTVSRSIIETHGGRISVNSNSTQGGVTTRISLPVNESQ